MVPDAGALLERLKRNTLQLVPSELGRVSIERASPLGLSNPPAIAFCPESHVAAKSPCAPGFSDQAAVFTVISCGTAAPIPVTIWLSVLPLSFFALSATSARFASGTTTLAATAVPLRVTRSASIATTSAGLGKRLLRMLPPFVACGCAEGHRRRLNRLRRGYASRRRDLAPSSSTDRTACARQPRSCRPSARGRPPRACRAPR